MSGRATATRAAPDRKVDSPQASPVRLGSVRADSHAQAQAAHQVVTTLIQALGLPPSAVEVRLDPAAADAARAAGARGLATDGVVRLDPERVRPETAIGRAVIAHELAHVAQIRAGRAGLRAGGIDEAEREADAVGRAAARHGHVAPPLSVLPLNTRAADSGGEAAANKPAEAATSEGQSFADLVARTYARQRLELIRHLSGIVVSDTDVERVMRVLEPMAFVTAKALVASLPPDRYRDLILNIDRPHMRRYRREVLAAYGTLTKGVAAAAGPSLFKGLSLDDLSRDEWQAAVHALQTLPKNAQARLADGRSTGPAIHRLIGQSGPAGKAGADTGQEMVRLVEIGAEDTVAGLQPAAQALLDALVPLLQENDEAGRRAALARVAESAAADSTLRWVVAELEAKGLVEPWLRNLGQGARQGEALRGAFLAVAKARRGDLNLALVEDLLSTSFFGFDWWVSDAEATLAFDLLTQMPAEDVDRFRQLDGGGLLRSLYDQLPRGYFERFSEDGDQGLLRGIEVLQGESGLDDEGKRLGGVLREALKNDPEIAGILRTVEDEGIRNAAAAYKLLVALSRMAGPALSAQGGFDERQAAFVRRQDRLRALVRYLDIRGHIETLFDQLDHGTLQSPDSWPMLTAVIAARDPALVEAHARRLLRERSFIITYDSVTTEEALLAFQLVRVLPPGRRATLEAADGGALWERMLGMLTPEMRAAGGLSYALSQPDANGETPLRRRLADPDLWQAKNVQQIVVLLEMAIASGDYAFAFRTSQRYRAWRNPVLLRDLVTPYLLYDPQAPDREPPGDRPRTTPQRLPLGNPDTSKSVFHALADRFRLAVGGRWKEGDAVIRLPFARKFDATFDLEQALPLYNDDFADDLLGYGQIADTRAEGQKRRPALTGKNVALMRDSAANLIRLEFSAKQGFARITSKSLQLDNAHYLGSGLTVRLGPVTIDDFALEIGFVGGDMRQPNRMSLKSSRVHADTPVLTSDSLLAGAHDLQVETVHVAGAWEQAVLPGLLGYLFSMLLDSIPLVGLLTRPASVSEITDDILSRNPMFVSGRLSFSRFTANEIHLGGGQRIASVSIRDAFIGGAGNRAAQARAVLERDHFAALSRHRVALQRLKAARATGDLMRAEQEMAAVEREFGKARDAAEALGRLATDPDATQKQETELLSKVRNMNRRRENLDPAEDQALAALQTGDAVGAKGGAAFFVGAIEVGGIEGDYAADDLAITNISGEGESAALVVRQLTTTALLKRFRESGPPAHSAVEVAVDDIGISGSADRISVGGIRIRGTIPSSDDLSDRVDGLPKDPSYDTERDRLRALLAKVVEYEGLHDKPLLLDRNGPFGRSKTEERQLNALERELSVAFGTTIKQASIDAPTLGFGQGDRRVAFGADRVELLGLQRDGLTLDSLVASDVNGRMGLSDRGFQISGFEVGTIELTGLDMLGESSRIWSEGTTMLTDLKADVTIPFLPSRHGPLGLDTGAVDVDRLTIAEVHAAKLGYTAFMPGTRERYYSVELTGGVIGGIAIENFKLRTDIFGEYDYTGDITIQTFDKVGFVGGFKTLAEADGKLSGPGQRRNGVAGQTEGAPAIKVNFAKQPYGETDPATGQRRTRDVMTVDLNKLFFSDTDADITTEAGEGALKIRRADLTGKIRTVEGDGVEGSELRYDTVFFEGIELGTLVLSRMRWRSDTGMRLDATGKTTLRGIRLSGRYITAADAAYIQLDSVHADSAEAEKITYKNGEIDLLIDRAEVGPQEAALRIVGIDATDVMIRQDAKTTKLLGGAFVARQAIADFALQYGKDLKVLGDLDAKTLSVIVDRGGKRISARAGDVDAELSIAAGDLQTDVRLSHVDTGDIVKEGNIISVGGAGKDGMAIEEVAVDSISFDSPKYTVDTIGSLPAMLFGIRARLDVHLHPDAKAKEAAGTPFEKAVIREFWIDDILASGLRIWLNSFEFGLYVPTETSVSLKDVHAAGPVTGGAEPFTIRPLKGGGFGVIGQIKSSDLDVDDLYVRLKKAFWAHGSFTAEAFDIGFLEDDNPTDDDTMPFQIDLRHWSAREIQLYVAEHPDRELSITPQAGDRESGVDRKVAGDRIVYDSTSGELIFDRIEADGLRYDDDVLGVHLDIEKMLAPRGNPVIISTAVMRDEWKDPDGNLLPGREIFIDQLQIDSADFTIDDINSLIPKGGSSGADEEPSPYLLSENVRNFIEASQALFLSMNLSVTTKNEKSIDVPALPTKVGVNLTVKEGFADYREIDIQLNNLPDGALWFDSDRYDDEVRLEAVGRNILRWDIPKAERYRLWVSKEVALHRLLQAQFDHWDAPDPDNPGEPMNTRQIVVEDIEIGLDIANSTALVLSLGDMGSVTFDKDFISKLHIEGDLQRLTDEVVLQHFDDVNDFTRRFVKNYHDRPGQFDISLDAMRIKEMDLAIPVAGAVGPAELNTGSIRITGVSDTTLDFMGLSPTQLKGHVDKGQANKVRFVMPPSLPKATGGAKGKGKSKGKGP